MDDAMIQESNFPEIISFLGWCFIGAGLFAGIVLILLVVIIATATLIRYIDHHL
jgi:hypothetical protein